MLEAIEQKRRKNFLETKAEITMIGMSVNSSNYDDKYI